jgi:hypothetical protein
LISIMLAMLGIVLLAALVVLYVAFPHRGQEVPNAPWVGDAMRKGVNLLPTLDNQSDEQKYDVRERETAHR